MSQRQDEIDRELEELAQDLLERPIVMSDLNVRPPDTMEFGELLEDGCDPDDLS